MGSSRSPAVRHCPQNTLVNPLSELLHLDDGGAETFLRNLKSPVTIGAVREPCSVVNCAAKLVFCGSPGHGCGASITVQALALSTASNDGKDEAASA